MKRVTNFILSLPGTVEAQHFDKTAFKVGKKIVATYDKENKRFCLKLSEVEQDVFCLAAKDAIYPVPNKWGKQGWTFFNANDIHIDIMKDALLSAYRRIAPRKLLDQLDKN